MWLTLIPEDGGGFVAEVVKPETVLKEDSWCQLHVAVMATRSPMYVFL